MPNIAAFLFLECRLLFELPLPPLCGVNRDQPPSPDPIGIRTLAIFPKVIELGQAEPVGFEKFIDRVGAAFRRLALVLGRYKFQRA